MTEPPKIQACRAVQLHIALGDEGKFHLYSPRTALHRDRWAIDLFPHLAHHGHTVYGSGPEEVYQAAHDWLTWWQSEEGQRRDQIRRDVQHKGAA